MNITNQHAWPRRHAHGHQEEIPRARVSADSKCRSQYLQTMPSHHKWDGWAQWADQCCLGCFALCTLCRARGGL